MKNKDETASLEGVGSTVVLGTPVAEHDEFFAGVCAALQVVTATDCGVTWAEIVRTVGEDKILRYAAHIEPEEWELAGFNKYALQELRRYKPRKVSNVELRGCALLRSPA